MGGESSISVVVGSPVTRIPTDDPAEKPAEGVALCLSGGGYRAMVFHLGALIRLNEPGLLRLIKRISRVSGGSITAAMRGGKWHQLGFAANGIAANLMTAVVAPIRTLASTTIDAGSIFAGILLPGTISEQIDVPVVHLTAHIVDLVALGGRVRRDGRTFFGPRSPATHGAPGATAAAAARDKGAGSTDHGRLATGSQMCQGGWMPPPGRPGNPMNAPRRGNLGWGGGVSVAPVRR